jgi:hypothetical protein
MPATGLRGHAGAACADGRPHGVAGRVSGATGRIGSQAGRGQLAGSSSASGASIITSPCQATGSSSSSR